MQLSRGGIRYTNILQLSAHLHRLYLGCNASKWHPLCPGNHIHIHMQIGAHTYTYDCKTNLLLLHMLCSKKQRKNCSMLHWHSTVLPTIPLQLEVN